MAISQNPYVHLETMEETEDKDKKSANKAVNWALNKERLISWGFYDLSQAYQSVHVNY